MLPSTARKSTHRIDHGPQQGPPDAHRPSGHLPVLDGLRGLAILLVLIYHFTLGMTGHGFAARLLFKGTSVGWCGVDLFFVLSGFLITGILDDAREAPHRFRNFYARRALRIFPLYYGVLAVFFAAWPWVAPRDGGLEGIEGTGIWLGLYGTNILVAAREMWFPLSHFWSLAVEEHFYLFWPAVVLGCARETAMRVCVALVLLALAVRVWLVAQNLVLAAYCLTVCRMDALAIGSFLALALRRPGGAGRMAALARRVAPAGALALVALGGWRFGLSFGARAVQTVGYLLLDVLFASLLVLAVSSSPPRVLAAAFNLSPLRWLGRYSYGLYVFNSIFILAADRVSLLPGLTAWTGSPAAGRSLYVALAASSTIGTSLLSWHGFEKHFLRLKRFFPSGAPGGGAPGASIEVAEEPRQHPRLSRATPPGIPPGAGPS